MKLAPPLLLLLTVLLASATGDALNATSSGEEQHLDLFFDAVEDEGRLESRDRLPPIAKLSFVSSPRPK